MARRRKLSFRLGRAGRRACRSATALALALICLASAGSRAQQPANIIVAPGNAAVAGFSGARPPVQIAPGIDPNALTLIDRQGPSLRVVDLQRMGGPPNAQLVGAPKPSTFTAAQIGQVFGVALDDASPPNIYAAATSAYGLPIVAPGADGQPQHTRLGAPGATFMSGLWGPQGDPGSIWKIDGATGKVRLFATMAMNGRPNSGAALGGIAFDADSKQLFVADRESGFIHRLTLDGRALDYYDHGLTGRQAQALPPVPWNRQQPLDIASPQFDSTEPATWNYAAPERRIFGLAVFEHRLYYAVADGLQIWSVSLNADGSFGDDAVIEVAVPPSSGPTEISKIAFDEQGRMLLAERPAPTGAFDFEALSVPAIGRVLRYAVVGTALGARRIWQEQPDEYAVGFPRRWRNGNGGIAIGYNYDRHGEIMRFSCGGFMWGTGEDLRHSSDAALAARLSQSGPLDLDGLQGNGTWLVRPKNTPPLTGYFVDYGDESQDEAARGHMGDIAIARPCTPVPQPPLGAAGGARPSGGAAPGGGPPRQQNPPPRQPPHVPPGGCPSNELRRVSTGACEPNCRSPDVQIGGRCCTVGMLAAGSACSNSSCPPGQTAVAPSNFCCNSSQVYAAAGGATACCSGPLVNGRCEPPPPPPPTSNCPAGYVPFGSSCCLANQMTSAGMCCPPGQKPSGPNKSQCLTFIPIRFPPLLCCPAGQIPTSDQKACCPAANVTSAGTCCSSPVDPNDRAQCRTLVPVLPACAPGYTKMPNGTCCNNRFVSRDGKFCNGGERVCPPGEFRGPRGICVPIPPSSACPTGEIRTREGVCVPAPRPGCPAGEIRTREGACVPALPACPPGKVRRGGSCVGGAPTACPAGQILRRGECLPIRQPACPRGQVRRDGNCVLAKPPLRPLGPGRLPPPPPRRELRRPPG